MLRRRQGVARTLLAYLAITIGFTAFYFTREGEGYMLPAILVLAVSLGFGVADLAQTRLGRWLAVAALVTIPTWQVWSYAPEMDASNNHEAAIYARGALTSANVGAVIYTGDDDHTFALWYVQAVEGLRPDVVVVDQRALSLDWYRANGAQASRVIGGDVPVTRLALRRPRLVALVMLLLVIAGAGWKAASVGTAAIRLDGTARQLVTVARQVQQDPSGPALSDLPAAISATAASISELRRRSSPPGTAAPSDSRPT